MTRHLGLALPSDPLPPVSKPHPEPVVIFVDAQGRAFLEGAPVEEEVLRERLRSLHLAAPDRGFVVRGAEDVEYQRVIDVFGLLDELQIANLGLDPQPGTTSP